MFKLLDHEAEIGILACAETLSELAREAARGLMRIMTEDDLSCEAWEDIHVTGDDIPHAIVNLLNELVWRVSARYVFYSAFDLSVRETGEGVSIRGRICSTRVEKYSWCVEVKAVTYSGLKYWEENGKKCFRVIVDV